MGGMTITLMALVPLASGGSVGAMARANSHSPSQVILVHPSDNLSVVVSYASPGDTLLLANGVYQPGVEVVIDKNLTIAAQTNGRAVLDGQGKHRVLTVKSGTVSLKGLNITGGYADEGGGIVIWGGTVAITGTNIYSNQGYYYVPCLQGGGVYINGGTVNFQSCDIHSNQAKYGGGVFVSGGTVNFQSCEIHNNVAYNYGGGGINIQGGTVTITGTNIYSNQANYDGGGVYVLGGTMNFQSCEIHNNTAYAGFGGGIAIWDGTMAITGTNVYSNQARSAGGIAMYNDGQVTMQGCNITSNNASDHGGGIYVDKSATHTPTLDAKTVVKSNAPDDCYGFWSKPACFGSRALSL